MAKKAVALAADGSAVATSVELLDDEEVIVTLAPKDAKGNAAKIDGVPQWQTSDATIATVVQGTDDSSATIRATGVVGGCTVSVTADADLGEGVSPIVGVLQVNVSAGSAVTVDISVGSPTKQQ